MHGQVYDPAGKPLEATIRIEAPNVPYQASTPTVNGEWVINNVPQGGDVTITVSADGYQPRVRKLGTGWYQPTVREPFPLCTEHNDTRSTYNFGGPATPADPDAPAFAPSARVLYRGPRL